MPKVVRTLPRTEPESTGGVLLPVGTGPATLPELAMRINAEHQQAGACLRSGLLHAVAAGLLLLGAKALAKREHRPWLAWLKDNAHFSKRTAQAYMQMARRWTELEREGEAQRVALLPFRQVLRLLAAPSSGESEEPPEGEGRGRGTAAAEETSGATDPEGPWAPTDEDTTVALHSLQVQTAK